MKLEEDKIKQFQKKILDWYASHQRDLPWRKTRDPYKILVSEVMSQQTQIGRVIPKYEAWLETFPTVEALANAKTTDVLKMWSGLGYNRRALNLQKTAQIIVKEYQGRFPECYKELEKLPGIGKYTSRAVACFAFNQQIAVVDTNIRKVIAVEFNNGVLPHEKKIEEIAQNILPQGKAYLWNQALMDYAGEMLQEHKIPIPKQSHFFTSNRYYRGQIIKQLLEREKMSQSEIEMFFNGRGRGIEKQRLQTILMSLEKDGFISSKIDQFYLSEV